MKHEFETRRVYGWSWVMGHDGVGWFVYMVSCDTQREEFGNCVSVVCILEQTMQRGIKQPLPPFPVSAKRKQMGISP